MSQVEELEAEVERLTRLNAGLANQVVRMGETLENGRRELLATGWDACADEVDTKVNWPGLPGALKAENPYRKPLPSIGDPE